MNSAINVFVGMSGGVDSSLTAALLKEQGYQVTGVYMKNWTQDMPGFACPWKEDFQDAKRVAVKLGTDFQVFDFEDQYRQKVVDYMIEEYKAGRTPNPDIMCNQEVKFKLFLNTAIEAGADMIATGHYARIETRKQQLGTSLKLIPNSELPIADLLCAKDHSKDQTYFLYRVSQDALQKTLFPIGEFADKNQVREEARKRGIATADKKDSQGICFVGKVGIRDFLKQYVTTEPGPIIDGTGHEIGQHDGAIFYTIGQRHGLNVGGGLPYYVTHKDMQSNTVFVTTNLNDPSLWSKQVTLRDLHWINTEPSLDQMYTVRLRYRGPLIQCKVQIADDDATISLQDEQRGIAAGQSAVLYENEQVVGGGVITKTL